MIMKVLELADGQNISEKETRFLGDAFFHINGEPISCADLNWNPAVRMYKHKYVEINIFKLDPSVQLLAYLVYVQVCPIFQLCL